MDAIKFLEERARMCGHGRKNCPAYGEQCDIYKEGCDYESLVEDVEAWSAAHPRKTRQSVFLEQYPNAALDKDGVLRICPSFMGGDTPEKYKCICLTDCSDCRREFWMQEVERWND